LINLAVAVGGAVARSRTTGPGGRKYGSAIGNQGFPDARPSSFRHNQAGSAAPLDGSKNLAERE